MQLHRCVRPDLPPLAWLLEIDGSIENHQLHCGRSVVVAPAAFFEGAWPGRLAGMDFAAAAEVFGSGGALGPDGWTIVTPSTTLEAVFCRRDQDVVSVSNSLPFLLAHHGDALDPGFLEYHRTFFDIIHGIDRSPIVFPSRRCAAIQGYFHSNFTIGRALEVTARRKPVAPRFADFAAYRGYLAATVKATLENAADPARPAPYAALTTASRGYDSVAGAVIAREAAGKEAITHGYARRAFGKVDPDSGEEIARSLGLEVQVFDRTAYLDRADLSANPEAEFLSHGLKGVDVNFLSFEPVLRHRVLFTGVHGDTVWDKNKQPNAVMARGDLSGASLGEFRLRVDFIHLPLPFIGALRHADLHAIANSPELAPYSIGGGYDRPVPRRIAEEAGIARSAFGMAKKATALLFFGFQPGLKDQLSQSTRRSLRRFAARWRVTLAQRRRLLWNALTAMMVNCTRLVEKRIGIARRLGLGVPLGALLSALDLDTVDTPMTVMTLHWAMSEMTARYSKAIRGTRFESGSSRPVDTAGASQHTAPQAMQNSDGIVP